MTVYQPAEDTYLLLGAVLKSGAGELLEVGAGTGVICTEFARRGSRAVCSDLSLEAVERCRERALRAGVYSRVDLVVGDLAKHLRVDKRFLVAFNPPYLPDDGFPEDPSTSRFQGGRDVIRDFMASLAASPAEILMVASSLTPIEDVLAMAGELGFKAEILARKRLFFEELYVVRLKHL